MPRGKSNSLTDASPNGGVSEELVVAMSSGKQCKNSIRFESEDPNLTNIYLGKDAVTDLGEPESIVVSITAG